MYQSVFQDIWGSDLIFAGPHKSFTNGNTSSNANHVIFGIHSILFAPMKTNTIIRLIRDIPEEELGLIVHPFPFNPQDVLDVAGEINPDFEEVVNSCNHIMEELDPSYSQHYRGVHKAIIPIDRMRELVYEDDTADTIMY